MGQWLNEKDAAARVGRSERTIRSWIQKGWLSAETVPTPEGPRERRIDVGELLQVAAAHGGIHRDDRGELLARIEHLEARLAALEALRRPYAPVTRSEGNLAGLAGALPDMRSDASSAPVAAVARTQPRARREASAKNAERWPAMPDGAMSFTSWCKARGVDHRSIERLIGAGRMPQPQRGEWQPGSGGVPIRRIYTAEDITRADAMLAAVPAAGEGAI